MLMSHLVYAPFSFQTRRRLRHSIPSDMDLTPTYSDELSETLQSMPSPSKPPEAKWGRTARYIRLETFDFSFVFEIIVRKSQLDLKLLLLYFLFFNKMFSLPYAYRDFIV